jgi:hypothetical protein
MLRFHLEILPFRSSLFQTINQCPCMISLASSLSCLVWCSIDSLGCWKEDLGCSKHSLHTFPPVVSANKSLMEFLECP